MRYFGMGVDIVAKRISEEWSVMSNAEEKSNKMSLEEWEQKMCVEASFEEPVGLGYEEKERSGQMWDMFSWS